jgi:hypothetical protein
MTEADEADVRERCAQCLSVIEADDLSYETPRDEILCGPCYFALWGPKGHRVLAGRSERRRPRSRRPERGPSIWIPGPTGEVDPRVELDRRMRTTPRGIG